MHSTSPHPSQNVPATIGASRTGALIFGPSTFVLGMIEYAI